MRLGLGLSVSQPRGTGAAGAVFDPATLPLTMWLRASYTGSPWGGAASTGASGANAASAGIAPAVGSAVNGLTPADFNGTTHYLQTAAFSETNFPLAGYAGAVLFRADTLAAPSGTVYGDPSLLSDAYGFTVGISTSGLAISHFDGAWQTDRLAGVSATTWTLGQFRYNGTSLFLRINGGAWSAGKAAATRGIVAATYKTDIGFFTGASVYLDGQMLEAIGAAALSDAQFDNYRSYLNNRYGVGV